jgi:hypothetical protein
MKLRDGEAMLSVAFEEARQSANCDGNQVEEPLYKEAGKSALEARRFHSNHSMVVGSSRIQHRFLASARARA